VGHASAGPPPTLSARLKLGRQWLHARELGFLHPRTQDEVRFVSDYPDDLGYALDVLRDAS
jgi:23S rRNA pseudouridine1911/1915/1917 synthase